MNSHKQIKPVFKPAIAGFALVVLSLLAAMSGPLGSRMGWWNFEDAVTIVKWAAYSGAFSSLLCLTGLIAARPGGKWRGFTLSLVGVLIVGSLITYLQMWKDVKVNLPPISDITTNTENPPDFWNAPNSRVYGGFETATWQQEAYPDIKPLILPIAATRAYDLALELVRKQGWQLWSPSREDLHIEATAKTFWFGFSDDVVIHITALTANSSRVDMRSTSRSGGTSSDAGTNARRIRHFLKALKQSAVGSGNT